ncbi:hypothetical protein J3Q64DRAFT_1751922 [Phycomyces blakesleeanus]
MSATLGPIDPTAWPSSYGRSKRIDLEQFYTDILRQNTPPDKPTQTTTTITKRKGSIRNRPSCGRKVSFSVEPPTVHEYESEQTARMDAWSKLDTMMSECWPGHLIQPNQVTSYGEFKRSVMSQTQPISTHAVVPSYESFKKAASIDHFEQPITSTLGYESFKSTAAAAAAIAQNKPLQQTLVRQSSQPLPIRNLNQQSLNRQLSQPLSRPHIQSTPLPISSPHKNIKRQVPKPRKLDLRPIPNHQYVAQTDAIVPPSPASTISSTTSSISPVTPTANLIIDAPYKVEETMIPLAGTTPKKSTSGILAGLSIFQTLSRMGSLQKKKSH